MNYNYNTKPKATDGSHRFSGLAQHPTSTHANIVDLIHDIPASGRASSWLNAQYVEHETKKTHSIEDVIYIYFIHGRKLSSPISAILENDEDGYIARCVDLPIYGSGDGKYDALESLKSEIDSLYDDLMEDDEFTPEWLAYKEYLISKFNG